MANYGGVNIITPQEVLAQLEAQRRQVMTQGNNQQRRAQNVETALDTIFGNPQLQLSKKITSRVDNALQGFQANPGERDVDAELRRLQTMRDAVSDLDPATASQINSKMLELGQLKLEQDKLVAGEKREQAQAKRESELHPDALALKDAELKAKASESQNFYNPQTGDTEGVLVSDTEKIKNLLAKGYIEMGKPTVQAEGLNQLSTGKVEPTKPVQTDLQTALVNADNQLAAFQQIGAAYDPSFLELPTQYLQSGANIYEKLGGKLSPENAARKTKYETFRSASYNLLNNYIKAITGAAMSEKETTRIVKAVPNVAEDGNTQFLSKTRNTVREILGIRKRAATILGTGLPIGKMPKGDEWDNISIPQVTNAEVDAFMQQYFGVGPSGQPSPKANADGWITTKSGARVREMK